MRSAPTPGSVTAFNPEPHIARINRDGYTIVEDFLDARQLAAFRAGVEPLLGQHRGRNPFEGHRTERIYTLVARGKVFEDITCDPRLMAIIGAFLEPNFLLSASHAICILPGEFAQALHSDDAFYKVPRPRAPLSVSVIGAIDPFAAQNGGTVMVPKSHMWSTAEVDAFCRERAGASPPPPAAFQVEMPPGAIAVFAGTLVHGAGANRSNAARLAFTSQYCEPWVRTQENFFLAIPRQRVAAMAPALQSLLGYSIFPPFMGMVTASHPLKSLDPSWRSPIERG